METGRTNNLDPVWGSGTPSGPQQAGPVEGTTAPADSASSVEESNNVAPTTSVDDSTGVNQIEHHEATPVNAMVSFDPFAIDAPDDAESFAIAQSFALSGTEKFNLAMEILRGTA